MAERSPGPLFRPGRVLLLSRRAPTLVAIAVGLGVLAALLGTRQAGLPSATPGASFPLWRILTLGIGVLPVLGLHSPLAALEQTVTAGLVQAERRMLLGLLLLCGGLFLALAAVSLPWRFLPVIARSVLAWFGLAMVSGRALGWRLAWGLPVLAQCVLIYWGGGSGGGFLWWEFTARPADDPLSWALTAALLTGGLLAYAATPWRLHRQRG